MLLFITQGNHVPSSHMQLDKGRKNIKCREGIKLLHENKAVFKNFFKKIEQAIMYRTYRDSWLTTVGHFCDFMPVYGIERLHNIRRIKT